VVGRDSLWVREPATRRDNVHVAVTVWSMLEECVAQLDEPFRRSEIVGWFRRHYPDVKETTLGAHIQAASANALNRAENNPLGRREPLLRRIDHGLYVRAIASGLREPAASFGSSHEAVLADRTPRVNRGNRARANVEALVDGFDQCVLRFESASIFSGPSVYFHQRAVERRRLHDSAESLLEDMRFLEYVYAVLPSWGMHRMGPFGAKVTEFSLLVDSLRSAQAEIGELWQLDVTQLDPVIVPAIATKIWQVISAIRASTSETQIVAGSKTLHHVLPDLVPPVDRQYTFRFFTGHKGLTGGDERAFLEWYPYLAEVGRRCSSSIDRAMTRGGIMATGRAKLIDNAIIGFMLTRDSIGARLPWS
jgi:hypothetical protein